MVHRETSRETDTYIYVRQMERYSVRDRKTNRFYAYVYTEIYGAKNIDRETEKQTKR